MPSNRDPNGDTTTNDPRNRPTDATDPNDPFGRRRRRLLAGIGTGAVLAGIGTAPVTAHEGPHLTLDNVGSSAWEVTETNTDGVAETGVENPTLTLQTGERYVIRNDGHSAHPLAFRDAAGDSLLSQSTAGRFEDDSAVNWEDDGNEVAFTLTDDLAGEIADYICTTHPSMVGDVEVSDTTAVTWEVPTAEEVDEEALNGLEQTITDVLGADLIPEASIIDGGVELSASGIRGQDELLHPVLDVSESFLQNEFGQPGEGIVKSTLAAEGTTDTTIQPSIELTPVPTDEQAVAVAEEVETLAALVLGVEVAVDAETTDDGIRLFVDTGVPTLGHIPVDVTEIVARRIAEREGFDVLDEDAHPIIAREPIAEGLGDNETAGGPIDGEAGNPLNPFAGDRENDSLSFDRPDSGDTRIAWHIPTGEIPSDDDVSALLDAIEETAGSRPVAEATDTGVLYELTETEFAHPLLDVSESVSVNAHGTPDVEGSVKSTLFVAGDTTDRSVQPSFGLSEPLTDETVAEIEFLYEFVAGVDAAGYHEGDRFFLDTDTSELGHLAVDVAEILVRRAAAVEGVTVIDEDAHLIAAQETLDADEDDEMAGDDDDETEEAEEDDEVDEADDEADEAGEADDAVSDEVPGFGALAALGGIGGAAAYIYRRAMGEDTEE